jgi:hypothetical protein
MTELLVCPTERKELPRIFGSRPEILVNPGLPACCFNLLLVLMHPGNAVRPLQLAVPVRVGPMDAQPDSL